MGAVAAELQYAWAGGLFEGEGCVSYQGPIGKHGRRSPKVSLGMNDKATVERFAGVMGCGTIYEDNQEARINTCYHWQTTNRKDFRRAMSRLYPWIGDRRREAIKEALRVSMLPKGAPSKEALSEAGKKGAMRRWNRDIERGEYHR